MASATTTAAAFAPAHITGFFQIFPNGSTGAGVVTTLGARTHVEVLQDGNQSVAIEINGAVSAAPVSRAVIKGFAEHLGNHSVRVTHTLEYPIGYGMGMSGAGAFSLSIALNKALAAKLSNTQCMDIARIADIECGTGLGDVVAQQFAGVLVGMPPYPSMSGVEIPSPGMKVVCAFFEPLETGKIIRNPEWKEKINAAGAKCMSDIQAAMTLPRFTELCRRFTLETGLASPQVREVIQAVPGCSMAMLGQTVFSITADPAQVVQAFSRFTDRITVASVSPTGATII